ncbi:WD40 repeat-like protein [Aspergillus phoenicis ATCC 13157]|uniref:Mitochondrial division protein 1 n=1 Tax=Aspergillus phoenicis ATCC 13157 TaxID=1353007 RepID=A0A370P995_ASPPH|nr:WD40 repeat-like protein [Aspergillus phoenicis ATCC 13157]
MEPSKYSGFRARFRQKLEGFRGGKPIKQNNQVGGYSTKNDTISSARHDSSETPARDENEHAYAAKTTEEDEHVSSTEAIQQESPQKNGQAFTHPNQNVTLTEWSTTIHNALWNEAYNNLKQDLKKAKYVEAYEKLVLAVFLETPISDAAGEGNGSRTDLGEERMKAVVAKGLERIKDSKKVMETVDNVSGVLTQVKAFLDIPLKNIPQTALPWAVISSTFDVSILNFCMGAMLTVQILVKPAKAATDLYNGVAYVVSRMSWYSKAVDKLLSEQNIKDNTSLEEMNHDLKTGIVDLYQSMLFYQIKSVCFYYKSQLLVLLRGFLDLDDWSGNLDAVKNAENALQNDLILYNQEHIKDQIRQITITSEHQEELDEYRNCLQSLRWIDPRAEIGDIQARNENIIEELYTWILLTDEYRKFSKWDHSTPARLWISGQAGTGKTMLLIGIIKDLIARGLSDTERPLVLYFFCQATNDQANNGVSVLRSLIWLLLLEQPQLVSHIQKEYFHSANRLLTDKNAFTTLRDIFRKMLEDKSLKRATIIIDAMDECEETSRELLTSFIDDASSAQELFNIKWLVSSRPLPEIPPSVQDVTLPTHSLLKLDEHDMSDSINRYIDIKMVQLRHKARKKGRVEEIANKIKAQASNTYIWVSLVCRELLHAHEFMWTEIVDKIPKRLEDLYGYLLNRLANLDSEIMSLCCKNVLNAAMLARDPLSLSEIEILAELPEGEDAAEAVVQECRSFLTIRNGTVYLIHQSAQDYLQKHYQRLYSVPRATLHYRMYQRALSGLRKALKENIYGLPHYGITTEEVQVPNPDPLISVRYACRYWVYHLEQSGSTSTDMEDILSFFNTHFLHWLEAMSLLGRYPDIVRLVGQLKSNSKTKNEPTLSDFLMDAEKFILHSLPVATRAPLQLYVSCLTFSPETSLVRRMFKKEACKWIRQISGIDKEWGALLQTLEHSEMVCCAAFSPDGKLVASGSSDHTVKIWDTATGSLQKILDHPATVYTVAFSPDNKLLASGSGDRFIRIWDTVTWRETERLEYSEYTTYLAFSPDSRVLASASIDDDVKLWEKGTESVTWERRNMKPTSPLKPMALSPDTQLYAAATDPPDNSEIVTLIDMKTGSLVRRLSHTNNVTKVAFSPDNRLVACALMDNTLTLWDTATWDTKRTVHYRYPNAPTFSPDGKLLTLNAHDGTVQLWNTNTETVEQTLLKSQRVTGVVFSPNGQLMALMSPFHAARLWKVIPGRREESEGYHLSAVMGVILSPDGLLAATYSMDFTIKLWITENGKLAQTLEGHKAFVDVAAFSPNSKLLASWAYDNTVRIWNTENGEQKWKFDGGGIMIEVMNFFAENKLWAAASSDDEGRVWNTETGHLEQVDSHDHESHMPKVLRGNSSIQCKGAECDISVEKEWVIVNRKKSIWLPPEYQLFSMAKDSSWAVRENTLVIGCDSGRVLFIWFDPVAMRDVIC